MSETTAPKVRGRKRRAHLGWLVPLAELDADDATAKNVGGKAQHLAWLARNGFRVPDTWVIPASAFTAALRELPPACEPRSLLRAASGRAVYARAADARHEILGVKIPDGLMAELTSLWADRGKDAIWGFAVRSSATCEDGALVSMAGLAESKLGVHGAADLAQAVRQVWASVASGRVLSYLSAHGVRDLGMAVVIQPVVRASSAGVMFTRSPSGARERIVNAALGLGAPVVDGVSTPDMLRVSPEGAVLEQTIAHKPQALTVIDGAIATAPTERPDEPALHVEHVAELARVARRLEEIEDAAWDVEFACEGDRVWIVQARHVTGRGYPEGGDANTVWSNVNVGEALPGVATPFTWSVARDYSESGFRRAFATLGCSVPKNARLVGNVYGRFYLNLTEFMTIAAQVPWLDPRTLVELGGGSGGDQLASQVSDVSHSGFYARLPLTAGRLVREQLRLDEQVGSFESYADRVTRTHAALDLAILPDEGLSRTIRDVQDLLERTGNVMLTCASSALGTHLALSKLLSRLADGQGDRLARELTRGIRDLESARPAIGVMRIVNLAKRDDAARAALERDEVTLEQIPEGPTRRAIQVFLDAYGDRAVREAELSTPRWKEDTSVVLKMVQVALRAGASDVEPHLARAKAQADAEMSKLFSRLNFVEQTAVRHLVARAQKSARLRERMRAWVTRVLGMLRDVALDADRRLKRLAPELALDEAQLRGPAGAFVIPAVFFLTVDEVVHALSAARTDLAPLVRARRAEHARDQARPDPPGTFIGAPPAVRLPASGGDVLRGTGASAGVVEGPARVLLRPSQMNQLEPGEILVVRTTDVGWTPLFCIAAGVVTELGGALSHAAVVARELGVPSVVNVTGATCTLRTGERVRIDGDAGTVERLAK